MSIQLKITTKGLRDAHGRYIKAAEDVMPTLRQRMQILMRSLRDAARSESPPSLAKYVGYKTAQVSAHVVRGWIELKRLPSRYPRLLWDYIINGTRPHVIEARNARALRFYWGKMGKVVFFKRVNHPGTDPNDFPRRAYRKVGLKQIKDTARRIGLDITFRLGGR